MKSNQEFMKQLDGLYDEYCKEVEDAKKEGALKDSTVRTYLLHSGNFVKWCKGNFEPGGRNK